MRERTFWATALIITVLLAHGSSFGFNVEICDNGVDDNENGLIDCLEAQCRIDDAECASFEEGCCVLFDCWQKDAGAGPGLLGEDVTCFDDVFPPSCAQQVEMVVSGGAVGATGNGESLDGLLCAAGTIVGGACSEVPACGAAATVRAPALSMTLLMVLSLLLAVAGAISARRALPHRRP